MIIYKDLSTDDELLSDVYPIKDVGNGLWEVDLAMVEEGGEDIVLEGANASAEGEDADDTEASAKVKVLNLVRDFRLVSITKPEKKIYQAEIKKYLKKTLTSLKEKGRADEAKEFQAGAATALKKITANWDNYDVYVGESDDGGENGMWILVDYREDGVTPYATYWRYAMSEMKV